MNLRENLKKNFKLTEKELDITFQYYLPEKIKAKSYFLKEGKVSDKVAYIQSGMLRSFIHDEDMNDITTHFFQAGTVAISLYSFNHRAPAKENIIAMEDSDLLVITYENMLKLAEEVPVWKEITTNVDQHKYRQQMNRSIRFQTLSASERYQQLMDKHPELLQKVALKHIASYLGIDIATLSRIRKKI